MSPACSFKNWLVVEVVIIGFVVLTSAAVRDRRVAPPTVSAMGNVGSVLEGRGERRRVRTKSGDREETKVCSLSGSYVVTSLILCCVDCN